MIVYQNAQLKNLLFIQNRNIIMKEIMKENKLSWNDVTYTKFQELREVIKIEDENERMFEIAKIFYGEEVLNLPLAEFSQKFSKLKFLTEEIPTQLSVKTVEVNGRKYYFDGLLGKISTAQYIDFQNYNKLEDESKVYSVFFIPEGHQYGDGYDMEQVFKDIEDMPISILYSASFFFTRQFNLFIKISQHYSKKEIRKLKIPKEMKKNLEQMITSLVNLASCHMSLNSVK